MSDNLPTVAEKKAPALVPLVEGKGLVPTDFDGLWRVAHAIHISGLAPKGMDSTEKLFVAAQLGFEVGLSIMNAIQNISVINGRPCIWGDAMRGLVEGSGLLIDIDEKLIGDDGADNFTAVCTAKRKGRESIIIGTFSIADAKKAGLWGKQGPWTQYPKRMLKMRARGFCLRDGFSDVLKGIKMREEVEDYIELKPDKKGHYIPEIPPIDTSKFDELAKKTGKFPNETLDKFIEATAKAVDTSDDPITVKCNRLKMKAAEDFDNFWTAYLGWKEINFPEKKKPIEKEHANKVAESAQTVPTGDKKETAGESTTEENNAGEAPPEKGEAPNDKEKLTYSERVINALKNQRQNGLNQILHQRDHEVHNFLLSGKASPELVKKVREMWKKYNTETPCPYKQSLELSNEPEGTDPQEDDNPLGADDTHENNSYPENFQDAFEIAIMDNPDEFGRAMDTLNMNSFPDDENECMNLWDEYTNNLTK